MCTSHQMTRFLLAYIQTIWNMAHTGKCTTATCILHVTGTSLLLRMHIVLWFMTRTKRPWIFQFCCLFACKAGAKCFVLRTRYTFAWNISGRTQEYGKLKKIENLVLCVVECKKNEFRFIGVRILSMWKACGKGNKHLRQCQMDCLFLTFPSCQIRWVTDHFVDIGSKFGWQTNLKQKESMRHW